MWACLRGHSDASLGRSICKVDKIADCLDRKSISAFALTDDCSISNVVPFIKKMEEKGKKWILGEEIRLTEGGKLLLLCRNLAGWKNLIKINNKANLNFYKTPLISLEEIAPYTEGLICLNGFPESSLALAPNKEYLLRLKDIFPYLFITIDLIDKESKDSISIAEQLRILGKENNIRCVATGNPHYIERADSHDQWIVLCSKMKTSLKRLNEKLPDFPEFAKFFSSNNYHIPSEADVREVNTEEEVENSNYVAELCESYSIFNQPILPRFECPRGLSQDEYLTELCREGWRKKIQKVVGKEKHSIYAERVKYELDVLKRCGLAGYFLIVRDFIQAAKDRGEFVGVGRGSIGGCLVAYLIEITQVDPIPYDLIFERFYNEGRNSPGHTDTPDADIDFQSSKRHLTFKYITEKYGPDKTAHIMTFGRLMGRGILSEVLRVHDAVSFGEIKKITKYIPDEAKISDKLQEMKEDGEEASILTWALINNKKPLSQWCEIDKEGNLTGDLSKYFAQAIRLEGIKKSIGQHAAGIVISPNVLADTIPMVYNEREGNLVCGLEKNPLKSLGVDKFDILSLDTLDVLKDIQNTLLGIEDD